MQSIEKIWRAGWTTCPGCGSFFVNESLLCDPCERYLKSLAGPHVFSEMGWTHRYLFRWVPGEDDILSNLIVALKGAGSKRAWEYWADYFICVHGSGIPHFREPAFIAAPATAETKDDHSSYFAKRLSYGLGPYLGRPLSTGGPKQRGLSRRARARRVFVKKSEWMSGETRIFILVDDIKTTGATAKAFRQNFSPGVGMELWTFASRSELSCDGI